jgi:hypothetical protein
MDRIFQIMEEKRAGRNIPLKVEFGPYSTVKATEKFVGISIIALLNDSKIAISTCSDFGSLRVV